MFKAVEQSSWYQGERGYNLGALVSFYTSNHKMEIWRMFQLEDSRNSRGMRMDNWAFRRVVDKGILLEEQLRQLVDWEVEDLEASFIYYSGMHDKLQKWVNNNLDDAFHIEIEDLVFYIGEIIRGLVAMDTLLDITMGTIRKEVQMGLCESDLVLGDELESLTSTVLEASVSSYAENLEADYYAGSRVGEKRDATMVAHYKQSLWLIGADPIDEDNE